MTSETRKGEDELNLEQVDGEGLLGKPPLGCWDLSEVLPIPGIG